MSRSSLRLVLVWVALVLFLSLTVAATFLPIGPLKGPVNLAIAGAKAALIAWVFMDLGKQEGLARVFALGALVWLAILFFMTWADLATRGLFG